MDGLVLFKSFKDSTHALVGFNSIGGFSTINHLHYQLFDVRALSLLKPEKEPLQESHVYMSEAQEIHKLLKTTSNLTLGEYTGPNRLLNAMTLGPAKILPNQDLTELRTLAE